MNFEMIKKFISYYWEIFVIFLLSLTPLLWLRHGEVILGHDSGFRLDPFQYLAQVWFSWNPFVGLGTDLSNYKGFLITQLPEAIFVRLTGSLTAGQTVSFVFWFFIVGVSMYVLLKSFFPEKKYWQFRLTASVFYMYNFFLLQGWFITERAKFSLFAALPLLVVSSWKTLDRKWSILTGSIVFGLTLFLLNGGGSPPLYGGILVSLGVLVLFFLFHALQKKSIKEVFHIVGTIIVFGVVTFLFNAYWLIPQAYVGFTQYSGQLSSMGGFQGILAWENMVSGYASFINLLRLQGIPDWYDNPSHPYAHMYLTSPLLVIASFIPISAILFVLFRQSLWRQYSHYRRFLFMCLLLLLIGLIMTAGSHPPLGFIYVALMRYVPGFLIFRTAFYKFGPSVWFAAIVLSSFAFFILTTQYIRGRVAYISVSVLVLFGILAYHSPYFTGIFFEWNKPFSTRVVVPGYVEEMFSYMNTHYSDNGSRIMLLPPLDSSFHADGYRWGFWGLDILPKLGTQVPVIANDGRSPIIDALYDAAISSNSRLFFQLAERIGIDKILWRGDVLYADKTTTSDNFRYMQDQLLQAPKITKEKEIGEWTLYDLESRSTPQSLIRGESSLYRADIDPVMLREFFASVALDNAPIVVGGSLRNKQLETNIEPFLQGNIVAAACAFCDPSELQQIENMFPVTYTRFLPDSPMYPLVRWKEMKLLTSFETSPGERIDADLAFATKRLAEVWGLINRDIKDNTESLALRSFAGFKERIDDAVNQSARLDEIDRNAYKARIRAYLKFYSRYLARIDEKNILPKDYISTLYEYLLTKIQRVSDGLWITDTPDLEKYYLATPADNIYELVISSDKGKPVSVTIDNQVVVDTSAVHLTEGVHKLALGFAPDNAIVSTSSGDVDITLTYGQQKVFDVPKILYWDKYALQFNYRVTKGKSMYMAFRQDNDAKDAIGNTKRALLVPLLDDGVWHSARYVIQPNFGAVKTEAIFFSADSTDEQSSVSISQLMVQNIKPADVFVIRRNAIIPQEVPTIQYRTLNAAAHTATVLHANHPFILHFQQSFDDGWKAFVVPEGQGMRFQKSWQLLSLLFHHSVDPNEHFVLDGLTNAWYMDKTGSYDVILVFRPFVIFLGSAICSLVFILAGLVILNICYRRYKS